MKITQCFLKRFILWSHLLGNNEALLVLVYFGLTMWIATGLGSSSFPFTIPLAVA